MDIGTDGRWEDCGCGEESMSCAHEETTAHRFSGMVWCNACGLTLTPEGEEE